MWPTLLWELFPCLLLTSPKKQKAEQVLGIRPGAPGIIDPFWRLCRVLSEGSEWRNGWEWRASWRLEAERPACPGAQGRRGCAKPRGPAERRKGPDPRAADSHASAPPSSAPAGRGPGPGIEKPTSGRSQRPLRAPSPPGSWRSQPAPLPRVWTSRALQTAV